MATIDFHTPARQAASPPVGKRLLHIVRSISPAAGGPSEGLRTLAEASAAGAASTERPAMELLCLDDPAARYLRDHCCPVHALGPGQGHYGYTPRLRPWLRENLSRFDGAVIHGLWQYHSYGSYRLLKGRVPYAVFPHGMLDPYFKRAFPLKHIRKQIYWLAREYRVLRDAKAVCFTTSIERDSSAGTMRPYRAQAAVVSFGASAPSGDSAGQRKIFFERFPELAQRRFFLLLSRIHAKKGCDLAVAALARLAEAYPDLDLVIAGPDESGLRPKLEAQARALGIFHRVHWTGMLQGDLKWGAICSAEAFLLPSHQENFGIAAVEALASGIPVLLSTKVNIWPEVLDDGAGIVNDDTVEGTYRSISSFLAMSRQERLRMAENGVRCFRTRYEMKRMARALNDLF